MVNKFFLLIILLPVVIRPAQGGNIVVAADGTGDFKTITEAISSLPMFNYGRVVIYIKNGIYNEKIRIEQDNVTLKGESREKTIIRYSQLREDWIKSPDQTGPAVVNIHADDIILDNLTIENSQPETGPHAFAVYGRGTRTIIINCNVFSNGGDTVSLWDYQAGMYYHADCSFRGSVDFVCPRGWCFIKDSQFFELKNTATLWHAGGFNKNQKLVVKNSSFDGVKGFELGRHHYDAQFYLLNCRFSSAMSNKEIYRVTYPGEPQKDRMFNWGKRYYFYNCSKEGGNPEWIKNNLSSAEGSPAPETITAAWTFDYQWDPESLQQPFITDVKIFSDTVHFLFSEPVTVAGAPEMLSSSGIKFIYFMGNENNTVVFIADKTITPADTEGLKIVNGGKMFATRASVNERLLNLEIKKAP